MHSRSPLTSSPRCRRHLGAGLKRLPHGPSSDVLSTHKSAPQATLDDGSPVPPLSVCGSSVDFTSPHPVHPSSCGASCGAQEMASGKQPLLRNRRLPGVQAGPAGAVVTVQTSALIKTPAYHACEPVRGRTDRRTKAQTAAYACSPGASPSRQGTGRTGQQVCELNMLEVAGVRDRRRHLGNVERLAALPTSTPPFPPPLRFTGLYPLTLTLPHGHSQSTTIRETQSRRLQHLLEVRERVTNRASCSPGAATGTPVGL